MRTNLGRILKEGTMAGLAAYAAVVLVLGLLDVVRGESFFRSAAAMGSMMFFDRGASEDLVLEPGPILAINGVHMVGSLVVGWIAAWQVFETEVYRALWYVFLTVLIASAVYAVAVLGVFGVEIGGVLDWTAVLVGTAAWVSAMTGYLFSLHRGLIQRIRREMESGG